MNAQPQQSKLLHGPSGMVVNVRGRTVDIGGTSVPLTRLSFDILTVLLERRGEVLTHADLAELAWGQPPTNHHGAIQTGVYRLRLALAEAEAPNVIRAIRGVGYTIDGVPEDRSPLLERDALEAALRSTYTPALLVDRDGRILLANDAAAELTGIEVTTLQRLPSWLALLAETSWAEAEARVADAHCDEKPRSRTVLALRPNQHGPRSVALSATAIGCPDLVVGVLVSFIEVTVPERIVR